MSKKAVTQAQYWKYAGWTLPFVALAILLGEILIGHDTYLGITSIAVVATFVATSVFWWWWSISKIVYIIKGSEKIANEFLSIRQELREIKKDVGDREWRESDFDQD